MRTSRPVQCSMEINALKWTRLGEKHEKVSGILHHSVDCRIWWMAGVLFIGCVGIARSQESGRQPLRLVQTISLPNVKGRLDHMDVDVKGKRLFVALRWWIYRAPLCAAPATICCGCGMANSSIRGIGTTSVQLSERKNGFPVPKR